MNLNYNIKPNYAVINYVNPGMIDLIPEQFSHILNAALYIFKHVFKIATVNAELISKDSFYLLITSIKLAIRTKVGTFSLELKEDGFKIFSEDNFWAFRVEDFYPYNTAHLTEFRDFQKEKIIIERFFDNKLELEVHFKNNGRTFLFEIPLARPNFVDLYYLNFIKENKDINALIRFYRQLFFNDQSDFDRNENITSISIYQKTDDFENYNKKGIKLDEVLLKNGLVSSYQLGNIRYNEERPVIITLKDGTYTITGYQSQDNDIIDINEMIRLLEKTRQGLDK